ncbi:hypothetical protein M5D96_010866, partial [Drosophila gunungcola]
MSLSERNTPSHGQGSGSGSGARQRPPDVEEALSSMLWTPYERTPLPSSSEEEAEEEDDDERLNRQLRKSHSSYEASALNHPHPHTHPHHVHHHLPLFAHHQQALDSGSALLLPPVPSFPPFSLSAFDAAIADFDHLAKSGVGVGGRRNRYSFPAYQGSPSRTLTQWCSSAATSIKEPPSYESLYTASSSKIGAPPPASSLILKASGEVGVALEPCDRSQRSPTKAAAAEDQERDENENGDGSQAAPLTANVPAGLGLRRSFTDDYISQTILFGNVNIINVNASNNNNNSSLPRTFTSTECQTDDLSASSSSNLQQQQQQQQQMRTREQRRKERRERRQQQQQQQQIPAHHPRRHPPPPPPPQLHPPPHLHHPHPHPLPHPHPAAMGLARALLPDILHAHYPPPYSALPVPVAMAAAPPPAAAVQQQPQHVAAAAPATPPALTSVISTVPLPGPVPAPLMSDGRFTLPLPIMR